jgi:hypothetical protein
MDDLTDDIVNEINHALQRGRDGESCAPYLIAENIKRIFREAGYVKLAENQSLWPSRKEHWRKIILQEKTNE